MRLVKIYDYGSDLKCKIAEMIIRDNLKKYHIEYCKESTKKACQNSFTRHSCGREIMDVFVVRDDKTNTEYNIGNNCIGTMVLDGFIENIKITDFKFLKKVLKNPLGCYCPLCLRSTQKVFHKACLNGKSKKIIRNVNSIRCKNDTNKRILSKGLLEHNLSIFKGIPSIRHIKGKIQDPDYIPTTKDMNTLCRMNEEFSLITDNVEKLLSLKRNCIIKSISSQYRKPSVKQMAVITLILRDFERIKKIDEEFNNEKYERYGYDYPK